MAICRLLLTEFYRVPDALQVPTGNSKIGIPSFQAGATNFLERLSQTETSLYGFYPSEPTKIDGRQTIDLSVNLNSNADLTSDIGGTNYVVFEARGYLITNANN